MTHPRTPKRGLTTATCILSNYVFWQIVTKTGRKTNRLKNKWMGMEMCILWTHIHNWLANHKYKKPKKSRTKSVGCRAVRNIISTGQARDHGPAVTHPLTPPSLTPWASEVNLQWTSSGAAILRIFLKLQSPFNPMALVCVSCCHPCNSWTNSESFTGPQGEGQHCRYTTYVDAKEQRRACTR